MQGEETKNSTVLNVSDHVDTAPVKGFHILIMFLCALIVIMDGFDLTSMGMVVPTLSDEWGVQQSVFSQNLISPLSAVLFGVVFGSIIAGNLGDRFGRRPVVIAMLILAAFFMGLTSTAKTPDQLIIYRFFTGIGAGGSIPIAIAMAAEFAPTKHRPLMVMMMYSGAPLGTSLGGIIGPELINAFGWQGIFYFGAITQLLITVLIFLLMPESVKFLARLPGKTEEVLKLLRRVRADRDLSTVTQFTFNDPEKIKGSLAALFTENRAKLTLTLWVIFLSMQFVLFFVSLMMPAFLKSVGWSSTEALRPLGFYNLGAFFGAIAIGLLASRIGPAKSLLISLPTSAVLLGVLGLVVGQTPLFFALAFFAGAITIGSGMGLAPLTAGIYPTQARSTGVGSALGVGRAGSILAPFIGAIGLNAALSAQGFFFASAIAPVVCFFGVALLMAFQKQGLRRLQTQKA